MSMDVHVIDDVCMVFGKGIKILKWERKEIFCNKYTQNTVKEMVSQGWKRRLLILLIRLNMGK